MKHCLVIICGLLAGSPLVNAGGQPTNACSFPEDQYLTLSLAEDQLREIDARRRITLSKSQLHQLRALAPTFPKRIGVASPFVGRIPGSRFSLWPDQVTGVWFCKDKVAIARDSLDRGAGCREFSSTLNDRDAVLIGLTGDYWIGPRKADRDKLIKCLDTLAKKEPVGTEFSVFLLRPPTLRSPKEELAVQSAVNDVVELCQERDLGCRIGG
jgi:hypothetical protein